MKKVLLLLTVLVCASPAMALVFTEDFESYITSGHSAGYMSPTWTEPAGYGFLPVTTTTNHTPAGSKSLLVNNNYGATKRGEQHTFGMTLLGTDANPLSLDYWITAGAGSHRNKGDVIVMLSMGEAGTDFTLPAVADPALVTPIPVIAYAKPYSGDVALYFFDGLDWTKLTPSIDSAPNWYQVNIDVRTSVVDLGTSAYPNYYTGANARPRAYLGGFDRISVLYEGRQASGAYWYAVDDISVSGVPEPATVALLGLGCLLLYRRRA